MKNIPEKFKFYRESVEYAKEAAKSVIPEEIKNWEELNQSIGNLAEEKKKPEFKEKILENWKEFAVSGVLQFDKERGEQVLRPFTDLDGRCGLGLLEKAGFDVSNLTYVKPGEYLKGAINLDTGDKFGVIYEEPSYSLYFDHHKPVSKKVTSTTEIVYKTMVGLRLLEKSEELDRLVDFVTKIDNRQYPPEEFLKSSKTILGLQKDLDFNKLLVYFKDHENPTEELTSEELEKYELKESSEKQQKIIDEAMETLNQMEKEGFVLNSRYGKIVINLNNRLKVGSSAAYVKYDGIVNYTPLSSFAITLKEGTLTNFVLPQGKLIRDRMWIYNERQPLKVGLAEIVRALGMSLEQREGEHIMLRSYELEDLHPPYELLRPEGTNYYIAVEYPDSAIKSIKEQKSPQEILSSRRIVEASLDVADQFIRGGRLEDLKKYYDSWKEIKSPQDMTFHGVRESWAPASDGWGQESELYVFPEFYEYLAFENEGDIEKIKNQLREKSFQCWLLKQKQNLEYGGFVWVGDLRINGEDNKIWIAMKFITDKDGQHHYEDVSEPLTFSDFEKICRDYLKNL